MLIDWRRMEYPMKAPSRLRLQLLLSLRWTAFITSLPLLIASRTTWYWRFRCLGGVDIAVLVMYAASLFAVSVSARQSHARKGTLPLTFDTQSKLYFAHALTPHQRSARRS